MTKWGLALKETIFQMAVLHLLMIGFQAIRTGDFQLVHVTRIMDLQFFFEDVSYSFFSNILLYIPILLLFSINLFMLRGKTMQSK